MTSEPDQLSRRFNDVIQRKDPAICAEIERWWRAAKPLYDTDAPGEVRCALSGKVLNGDAREEADALQRDEYELFYARLVHAFNNDDRPFPLLDKYWITAGGCVAVFVGVSACAALLHLRPLVM